MKLENTFRFKLTFTNCKTYEDIFERLKWVEDYFKTIKSLGVKKTDGAEDDYHRLELETPNPKKIKQLKKLGFMDEEELYGEEE
mgnify:CR=1 FL=1|jgi:hypothetical protein